MLGREPLHDAAHRRFAGVKLTQITHLAATCAVGDRNRVPRLGHIDFDENPVECSTARPPG